jgi:hypothetical protein
MMTNTRSIWYFVAFHVAFMIATSGVVDSSALISDVHPADNSLVTVSSTDGSAPMMLTIRANVVDDDATVTEVKFRVSHDGAAAQTYKVNESTGDGTTYQIHIADPESGTYCYRLVAANDKRQKTRFPPSSGGRICFELAGTCRLWKFSPSQAK